MALPVPNLDDRTFQDLVREARSKIPLSCPEWTDHNASDPGITLIELFAWMTDMIIYRLNQVPDKNYIKFLELLGVQLAPASPATTELTFWLSAPQDSPVQIPRGTAVSTPVIQNQEPIVFTTDEDLNITPPTLDHFLVSGDGVGFSDHLPHLGADRRGPGEADQGVLLFQPLPQPDNAFYLGYRTELGGAVLMITLECVEQAGLGINPANPPLEWEYWDISLPSPGWVGFQHQPDAEAWVESDTTLGLNSGHGQVVLHVPHIAGKTSVGGYEACWVRCRVTPWTLERRSYTASPRVTAVDSRAIGGRTRASNAVRVFGEVLGTSNGRPGQVMRVPDTPVLALEPGETLEVQSDDDTGWEPWSLVEDFSGSGRQDKHFAFDPVVGEVRFGPSIRSRLGEEVRYGAVPPPGSWVRLNSYRSGGGRAGNVGRDTLTILKSSIPFVARVTNRWAATGGMDPEGIEEAKVRGRQALHTGRRAVTQQDFEHLARQAPTSVGRVARARCLQPTEAGLDGGPVPGVVQVLLVPGLSDPAIHKVEPDELRAPRELLEQVREYLDQHRLLNSTLVVSEPDYVWVSVEARVKVNRREIGQVRELVEQELYRFIHPLYGGMTRDGWPFGHSLFRSELYARIQSVPGVAYTEDLKVYRVDPSTWERGEALDELFVPETGVLCSHSHVVTCF